MPELEDANGDGEANGPLDHPRKTPEATSSSRSPDSFAEQGAAPANSYDLFISYNSKDRSLVERIHRALAARGIRAFFDHGELAAGRLWIDDLTHAIENSRSFVLCMGGHDLGKFQKRELQLAFVHSAEMEHSAGTYPIVPVLLDGASEDCITGFLSLYTRIDLRGNPDEATIVAALREITSTRTDSARRARMNPFRGLRAFREQDERVFFGREEAVQKIVQLVKQQSLVAVVGPSGSGKSSVVSAGVLAELRRERSPSFHSIGRSATCLPWGMSPWGRCGETSCIARSLGRHALRGGDSRTGWSKESSTAATDKQAISRYWSLRSPAYVRTATTTCSHTSHTTRSEKSGVHLPLLQIK